ncbi:hypothetical protein JXM67_07135 [candidate division WOR-3 bacterium]|nr:hypothetical protein [candidate division WOR-3 bacterium]
MKRSIIKPPLRALLCLEYSHTPRIVKLGCAPIFKGLHGDSPTSMAALYQVILYNPWIIPDISIALKPAKYTKVIPADSSYSNLRKHRERREHVDPGKNKEGMG